MDVVRAASEFGAASGAAVVGACWAVWAVFKSIKGDLRDSKQQAVVDQTSNAILTSLQAALADALKDSKEERARSQELSVQFQELGVQMGRLQASLEHSQERRGALEKEVAQLKDTVEELVEEIRNKDRSIEAILSINTKLLRTIETTPLDLSGEPAR